MNNNFLKSKILLNSARNCLKLIVKSLNISRINVPYYICPVVRQALKEEKVNINFYHIDKNFMPIGDFEKDDFVLYVNYFGLCSSQNKKLAGKYKNLISDNAHAFFAEASGIASFNSVRKFFNVNDGGLLDCGFVKNIDFGREVDRNIEIVDFDTFLKNELSIDNQPIKNMSLKTENFLKNVDFEQKIIKNRQIYTKIDEKLGNFNNLKFELDDNDVPMVYPFLSEDFSFMELVAKKLENEGVYLIRYGIDLPKTYPEYAFSKIMMIPLTSLVPDIIKAKF